MLLMTYRYADMIYFVVSQLIWRNYLLNTVLVQCVTYVILILILPQMYDGLSVQLIFSSAKDVLYSRPYVTLK